MTPERGGMDKKAIQAAYEFIKKHHWRFCPPQDKWPEGSWSHPKAKEVCEMLLAAGAKPPTPKKVKPLPLTKRTIAG